jgi:hypothetical protein
MLMWCVVTWILVGIFIEILYEFYSRAEIHLEDFPVSWLLGGALGPVLIFVLLWEKYGDR